MNENELLTEIQEISEKWGHWMEKCIILTKKQRDNKQPSKLLTLLLMNGKMFTIISTTLGMVALTAKKLKQL